MDGEDIISEVMEDNGLRPEDIPGYHRFWRCKGFASFDSHFGCSRRWKSAHAWCKIDLRDQIISEKYTQGCQKCNREATPDFDDEAIRRMAEYAVNQCLIKLGRRERPQRDPFNFDDLHDALDDKGPHDEARCQMCKELGRSCWK